MASRRGPRRRARKSRRRYRRTGAKSPGGAVGPPRSGPQLVEVDLPLDSPDHWLREATERWRLRVRLDLCRPAKGRTSRMIQLVELTGKAEDLDAVERHLRRRPGAREVTVVPVSPTRRFIRAVTAMPEGCRRAFEVGAACLTCQLVAASGGEGSDHWTVMLPGTRRALRLVGRMQPPVGSPASQLLGMRRFIPRRNPTPRQAAAIEVAYRLGYYSFPRRSSLGELARTLAVSRSTASELLRRAEGSMLARELDTSRS